MAAWEIGAETEVILDERGHNTPPPVELPSAGLPEAPAVSAGQLRANAQALLAQWELLPAQGRDTSLPQRLKDLATRLDLRLRVCRRAVAAQPNPRELSPALELLESTRMLQAVLAAASAGLPELLRLPHVRLPSATSDIPRLIALAEAYLSAAGGIWSAPTLSLYIESVQSRDPLLLREIGTLPLALKLAQLEFLLDRADETFAAGPLPPIERSPFSAPLHSLRRLNQVEWNPLLEPLIAFEALLRQDPTGTYPLMDDGTRGSYQRRVAQLAAHADANEVETARAALHLAQAAAADPDPRRYQRRSHLGFFLFAEGAPTLEHAIGYHAPPAARLRAFVRRHNEDLYILGIFVLAIVLIFALIAPLVPHHELWPVVAALLLALLPASQAAVDLVNSAVSALLEAEALPKLDFAKAIPADCATLVVVPTLLLSQTQVAELFDELEARFLANPDPHLHFGLLTDLPDTPSKPAPEEHHPLVQLAIRRTEALNTKYAAGRGGGFLLLHRHRVFNARQGVWMGWERKRGKLLDLNKLLLRDFDSFPIKAGRLEALDSVRYVITLDSDTQLPRGAAARMVGTLAHPLNRAIIDPRSRVVTHGYGILQPRVGVSVTSASRSRLAAIYSGETGFDIYTRAVSDVYQDLFGEGIFTGKGIYEVEVLHRVLDHRFPRNALLSHDLIEGAYVRAGLVTDVEVIDDYPSRYAAHARRKHRWVRGDWQIAQWLFGTVPDESGRKVPNPISTISRWKIFDNLRRSLVEPITFLLLVLGWFALPGGPRYWTVGVFALLLLPTVVQFSLTLLRAALKLSPAAARDGARTLDTSLAFLFLHLAYLPHQMLLSLDAIVRSALRLASGKNLLEWETAAQAEAGTRRSSLDLYLQASPVVAGLLALSLYTTHSARSLLFPAPILIIWAVAPLLVLWLDASPRRQEAPLSADDTEFLRRHALHIWRFFAEFGGPANHWLIPDNVEEAGTHQVRKLSPTNLGMLLNARQAAVEFGFLTLSEFAEATLGTLGTYDRLQKVRGHLYNWYDLETLAPVPPFTISTVDSGNLAASFYTLHTGALDLLSRFPEAAAELRADLQRIADRAFACADAMDFRFLLVPERQLLSIGYDAPTHDLHTACYDLLSSEARIASFLAVAKGDIPQQAWFRLDRSHVQVRGRAALVSWTGTMFEYLMPSLWMQTFPNTLLSRSLDAAVRIQRDAVRSLHRGSIPWGISESGFTQTDAAGRYGYNAFGIPALALKYGADPGPVVTPYATFLALPFLRTEALGNLRRMEALGWTGTYGFYEAADYIEGTTPKLVRSWMAHHQGMSLLSLLNVLHGNIAQRWFHANPRVRAAELLLHEKPVSEAVLSALPDKAQPPVDREPAASA